VKPDPVATQQGDHYGAGYDYNSESPHLKHRHLHERLLGRISAVASGLGQSEREVEALEIGAGDGSVSSHLLAVGCDVTASEMSADSVETMNRRFAGNGRFRAVLDPDGSLDVLGDRRFDLILYASVLHHIPDYKAAIEQAVDRHLRSGGAMVAIQDPLWYPRMSRFTLRFQNACYLSWRLTRGNLLRGLRTRTRRARHGLSEVEAGDAIEYHVVRNGVDEQAIEALIGPRFNKVEIDRYWSSQGTPQQLAGEKLGLVNTFAVFAEGHRPANRVSQ